MDLQDADVAKMKVVDLKRELKTRNLSTSGSKSELVARLQQAIAASESSDLQKLRSLSEDLSDDALNDDDIDADLHVDEEAIKHLDNSLLNDKPDDQHDLKRKLSVSTTTPKKKIILCRTFSVKDDDEIKNENVDEEKQTEKKIIKLSSLSNAERLEMRAKKFGSSVDDDRKLARLKRFGLSAAPPTNPTTLSSVNSKIDILTKRAERFGDSVAKVITKLDVNERLERRKARFGAVV